MLFQNDQGGKVLGDIYEPIFKAKGIETSRNISSPAPRISPPVLAKIAAFKPDYLFPGYADAPLYDIVRQATEGNFSASSFWCAARSGPGLKNKDGIDDYVVYVPKYFEEAEKNDAEGRSSSSRLQGVLQARFPLRPGAALLVVLLRPRLHAGRGDAEGGDRRRRGEDPRGAARL